MSAAGPKVLLVVGGGIAAYKSCELVRLIRKGGADVTCVVTKGGQQFVTPMSLAALSENQVHTSLFDLKNEVEMGHIELSREADLVVVCPATADLMAKMAAGIADDLATTLILATNKPVMAVPAMNVKMWEHASTQRNVKELNEAGVTVLHPDEGAMACGEFGYGRLPEPPAIWAAIAGHLGIEIPEEESAPVAANDAVEALEPDNEGAEDGGSMGGLGGLLSRIIPRSTEKRSAEDIDADLDAEAAQDGSEELAPEDFEEEDIEFNPDLAGSPLATKGAGRAAPPMDPDAINHEVDDRKSAPEIIEQPEAEEEETAEEAAPRKIAAKQAVSGKVQAIEADEAAIEGIIADAAHQPLDGRHVLVTAGPTWESIDPVRYIANRSSGKQGFAIAAAAAALGAEVTLVAGPVALKTPGGVNRIDVESAEEMSTAVKRALPCDVAVMVAAVADWRPKEYRDDKIKKRGSAPPALMLTENPDILTNLAAGSNRPELVIGFAAETDSVLDHAKKKRKRKACDWIVANDVSGDVMGGDDNRVHIVTADGVESLDKMPKSDVAIALAQRIATALEENAAK